MQDGSKEVAERPTDEVFQREQVVGLWSDVIGMVNRILKAHTDFGFVQFEAMINPSLDVILHSLSVIESAVDSVMESDYFEYEEVRQGINAKQCILHVRLLAKALKENNQSTYHQVIETLQKQPQI